MNTFKLLVLSPNRAFYIGDCVSLVVPLEDGLFGIMAFVLPFLVFVFAALLMAGKLQHIGARTTIFSILIFINMCVLNSYRYIDPNNLRFGFSDIVDYYIEGIEGKSGGVFGMEIGSILAKLFGMPGLLIIAISVLIISIFLVANTPRQ